MLNITMCIQELGSGKSGEGRGKIGGYYKVLRNQINLKKINI